MTRPERVLKQSPIHHDMFAFQKSSLFERRRAYTNEPRKLLPISFTLCFGHGLGRGWSECLRHNRREDCESPSSRPLRPHLKAYRDDSNEKQPIYRCHRLNLTQPFIRGLVITSPEKRLALISDLPFPLLLFPDYSINLPRQNTT